MSNLEYAGGGSLPVRVGTLRTEAAKADAASRRWRTIWRTHFYAGIFAAPFMVLMALTGLVILYTQPITNWTQHDLRTVHDIGDWQSFDAQSEAVIAANPDNSITRSTRHATPRHRRGSGSTTARRSSSIPTPARCWVRPRVRWASSVSPTDSTAISTTRRSR